MIKLLLLLLLLLLCPPTKSRGFAFCHQFSSVQSLSRVWLFPTPWSAACQTSLSITISRSSLRSRPSSPWCHPAISSSVVPFSSCPQSLPASESFPMSQVFAWGGQTCWIHLQVIDVLRCILSYIFEFLALWNGFLSLFNSCESWGSQRSN